MTIASKWKAGLPILATASAAIFVRVHYLFELRQHPAFLEPILDASANVAWARGWLEGTWPGSEPFFRAPGYIWALAMELAWSGGDPVRAAILQILLGAVTPVLTAILAARAFGNRAAWIAGLGAALDPMLPFHDGQLLDPFLQIPLFLVFTIFACASLRDARVAPAVIAGILGGALAIVRPPMLLAVAMLPAACVMRGERRRALLAAAAALLFPLVVTAMNAAKGDAVFIASQGGLNFYLGNHREADGMSATFPDAPAALGYAMVDASTRLAQEREGRELRASEVSSHYMKRTFEEIRAEPAAWTALMVKKLVLFWTVREIPNNHDPALFAEEIPFLRWAPGWGIWAPWGIAGAFLLRRKGPARFLAALVAAIWISSALFFVADRFRLPALPLLIVLAAAAFAEAVRLWKAGARRAPILFVAAGLVLTLLLRANPYHVPQDTWIMSYVQMAEAERNRGENVRALGWIERALAKEPGLYAARRGPIELLRKVGRTGEAKEIALALARDLPQDASLRIELGVILDVSGDSVGALREFDEALRLDSTLDIARVYRAVARARTGDVTGARAELETFLRERPQSPEASRARAALQSLS
jgi:tetratricopeptide (TPR) repeat protein